MTNSSVTVSGRAPTPMIWCEERPICRACSTTAIDTPGTGTSRSLRAGLLQFLQSMRRVFDSCQMTSRETALFCFPCLHSVFLGHTGVTHTTIKGPSSGPYRRPSSKGCEQ